MAIQVAKEFSVNLSTSKTRETLPLLAVAVSGIGCALLTADLLVEPVNIGKAMTNFVFFIGFSGGLLLASLIFKNNYIRTLMRLYGWNGGGYAVWVRMYADGRMLPERNSLIVSCPDDLPSVRWDPCKGKEATHVIVRGQVYTIST